MDPWRVESKTQASLELRNENNREVYVSQYLIARIVFSLGFMFLPIKLKAGDTQSTPQPDGGAGAYVKA